VADSPHQAVYALCQKVAAALKANLPAGFRGKLTVNILDSNGPLPHDVVVEFRPPQPKAGMTVR
jgi:hypothetical protein